MYFISENPNKIHFLLLRVSRINLAIHKKKPMWRHTSVTILPSVTLFSFNLHFMPPSGIIQSYNFTNPIN
jgi:hypothetical protein